MLLVVYTADDGAAVQALFPIASSLVLQPAACMQR